MTRVGNVPGNVGAVRSAGGMADWSLVVVGVPLVVVSPGRPISVVDSRTGGYEVDVEPVVVLPPTWGGAGRCVPGGSTVSVSDVLHLLDIVTTA